MRWAGPTRTERPCLSRGEDFPLNPDRREAEAVIEAAEVVRLTARDHARVLELLENPPKPNAKLRAAIAALPDTL
ncbi:type II toxin -antitoxin system TacA 1-like antitoxin [Rhizobium sp. CF142]|uniref:type II toxin -antitoxin system TacA 1-like antitoxin n=1 Tax=Rhizobium sp. CF142 TaxID=1144314 RepID=UPI00244DE94D|nr:DUF1778 domain-containing protein [Rhizobium sp. CF142]